MRPGQNKRMRSRNNNNRKGPNPLTRTYESNGPDVKIRGTAHHVAEKYLQLARDAQSSGDPVMAESYLQHAEHYFRLIAAAQLAQQQAQQGYMRQPGEPEPEEVEDDDDGVPDRFASPFERQQQQPQPQPFYPPQNGQPPQQQAYGERPYNNDQPRQDRPYQDRNNQQRQDRPYQDRNQFRNNNGPNRGPRDQRPQRDFRNDQRFEPRPDQQRPPQPPQQPMMEEAAPGLPSFITAPVRAPDMASAEQPVIAEAPIQENGGETGRFHLRNRRRRRPAGGQDEGGANEGADTASAGE